MPKLTPTEVSILFALMAEGGAVSNTDLQGRYGFTLTGESRRKLNDDKLVESRKRGRSYEHEVSEIGWARCRDELTAAPPPGGGTAGGALYAVLRGLGRYLDRANLSLADVFGPTGGDADAGSGNVGLPAATTAPAVVPQPRQPDVEADIRAAYRSLVKRPGGWVRLADLRPLLGTTDRAEVDATLILMGRAPRISVVPNEDQKSLTRSDHDAAVLIGGQENHLIAIEGA